jgi:transposase
VIRVDAVWLAVAPLDMRAGTETALVRVVNVFGAARPHHAYLFANRRANRMKVLVLHADSTKASSCGLAMAIRR